MPSTIAIYIPPDLEITLVLDNRYTAYMSVTKLINNTGQYSRLVTCVVKSVILCENSSHPGRRQAIVSFRGIAHMAGLCWKKCNTCIRGENSSLILIYCKFRRDSPYSWSVLEKV